MPRDLQRTRPVIDDDKEESPSGQEEFGSKRERVTRDVSDNAIPDFITPGSWAVDKRQSSGPKVDVFKVEGFDDEILIKFLEEGPFAPIMQHWVMVDGKRRPYTCITPANDCPMCARGDRPKSSDWFNVIEMPPGEAPVLKVFYASPDPAKAIKQRAENKRTQPLNKNGQYFVVSKSKDKSDIPEYHLDPVREDELGDWDVKPLTSEQIAKFNEQKYDATLVKVHSKSELTEVARNNIDND